MTVVFQPDIVLPDDEAGFGNWLTYHYFEHLRFLAIIKSLSPTTTIPDYAFNAWPRAKLGQTVWLSAHQNTHQALRQFTGVSGTDLSVVDFSNRIAFFEWMDTHAQEHSFLRAALGAT